MLTPYPLRLAPFFRDYLWGGRKLQTALGKNLPADGAWAESWEIVDHAEHSSQILNGPLTGITLRQLSQTHPTWLHGGSTSGEAASGEGASGEALPLLLKYLDCQRVLSVQVHPDDAFAQRMDPPDLGKTEAWYIIAAEPDAVLYAGLNSGVAPSDLRAALAAGTVEQCLHAIHPRPGDCVFIPAGTVHALGAGLLVAEIQQASNTTFRLFDWNRVDAQGQPRELHVEQSLEVIDFSSGPRNLQTAQTLREFSGGVVHQRLVECDKFVLDRLQSGARSSTALPLAADARCHLLTVPVGTATIAWDDAVASGVSGAPSKTERLDTGQSLLLPAAMPPVSVLLEPNSTLLDMFVP